MGKKQGDRGLTKSDRRYLRRWRKGDRKVRGSMTIGDILAAVFLPEGDDNDKEEQGGDDREQD